MSGLIVGVDVGGTKVSVAAMRDGQLGEPQLCATDTSTAERLVAQIVGAVHDLVKGEQILAVGVGIPSVVEFATGRVRSSVNIPLRDVPLRQVLEAEFGAPTFVDNDATVAAFAEAHDANGVLDVEHLVMFTVGTGVGGGIVIGGRPYRGATGAAAEIGHTLIAVDHLVPRATGTFPQPGSLEILANGQALDRLSRAAAAAHPDSPLAQTLNGQTSLAGPDVVSAAQQGAPLALAVLNMLGRRIGIAVANAINTFDPQVVAIGGGISAAGELLVAPIRETAKEYVLDGVGTQTEIRLARSGAHAGVRGAALLARSEL
ncbi:MAG: ROK family protein [Solirubrobacteraceae bacterium]|jgi:glucokinase